MLSVIGSQAVHLDPLIQLSYFMRTLLSMVDSLLLGTATVDKLLSVYLQFGHGSIALM